MKAVFPVPRNRAFFVLFEQASSNLVEISTVLNQLINAPSPDQRPELVKQIDELEHRGDQITHDIYNKLGSNFITPFDREDIHALITALDDIVDFIHGAAKRIQLYKVQEMTQPMKLIVDVIQQGANELHAAITGLRHMRNAQRIKEACVRINSLENHADDVFDMAIADLFDEEKDAIKLIKVKEILSALETATDKCEDAANVLENIILKNA